MTMDRLADHVKLLTGFPFKSASYSTPDDASAVRLVRGDNVVQGRLRWGNAARWPAHLVGEVEQYLLEAGDVVLAMDRPWIEAGLKYARITVDDLPSLLVQRVARLRTKPELDQGFLYYLIGSKAFTNHVLAIQTGTAVPHISGSQILEFEFALPELKEQRAIAGVVGSLDDKIEQNRRTSAALEKLARAIFRAWFVDFEPVKAKAAGATIFPSMPQEVFDSLPAAFVDSELGPIPEGWEVGVVGDAATISKPQLKPQEYLDEVFEHFSIPAYDDGKRPAIEPGSAIKSSKFLVQPDCVLFSKLNPRIPRVWLPSAADELRQIASTEFLVTTAQDGWSRNYLYCLFQLDEFREVLAQSASGTSNSHQRIRPADLLSKQIVVPTVACRRMYEAMVDPIIDLSMKLHAESRKLAELRDYLLPKLLSGSVRVRAAEEAVEEVA